MDVSILEVSSEEPRLSSRLLSAFSLSDLPPFLESSPGSYDLSIFNSSIASTQISSAA